MDQEHAGTIPENPPADTGRDEPEEELSAVHKDALAEVGNISMGAAATALSHMLNKKVQITIPQVSLVSMENVRTSYPIPCIVIVVNFLEGLQGDNIFILREKDALIIAGLIMGMEPPQGPAKLGEMELSAISEAMNQMMGSAATAMSELLNRFVNISSPLIYYLDLQENNTELEHLQEDTTFIQIAFRIEIEELLDSDILQLTPFVFGRDVANRLLAGLTGSGAAEAATTAVVDATEEIDRGEAVPGLGTANGTDAGIAPEMDGLAVAGLQFLQPETEEPEESSAEELFQEKKYSPAPQEPEQIVTSQAEKTFGLLEEDFERINLIKDFPVEISAVLGKTTLSLRQVFSLSPGEVINLENYAGEPVELLANERLVAKGEVVLVNGKFGVIITNIVGPKSG